MLADGSTVELQRFDGFVEWHDELREVMVLAAEGGPLIGMSLLRGSRITIDVDDGGLVAVEPLTQRE